MQIEIYSTPTCPYCVMAKNYFKSKNIAFQDFDVARDQEKAQEMIQISGQMGVPVIKIDEKVIVGFDQEEIDKILQTTNPPAGGVQTYKNNEKPKS